MKNLIIALTFIFSACGGEEPLQENTLIQITPRESGKSNFPKVPPSFSWTHVYSEQAGGYVNYVSTISMQIGGSCTLFAMIGALEIQRKIETGMLNDFNLSEQNVLSCKKVPSFFTDEIATYLQKYGVLEERFAPANEWTQDCQNCNGAIETDFGFNLIKNVPFYGVKDIIKTNGKNLTTKQKKSMLVKMVLQGPVVIGADAFAGFEIINSRENKKICTRNKPSGHVFIVVGYQNSGDILIVKNSWGGTKLEKIVLDDDNLCGVWNGNAYQMKNTWVRNGEGENWCSEDNKVDWDHDGVPDNIDNCPRDFNPEQQKTNQGNVLGDACSACPNIDSAQLYVQHYNPYMPCATTPYNPNDPVIYGICTARMVIEINSLGESLIKRCIVNFSTPPEETTLN